MIIRDLIQRVTTLYSKGAENDDTRLSDKYVYSKLLSSRSRILEQKLNKRQHVNEFNYQTLKIEMEQVNPVDCVGYELPGCNISQSVNDLPETLNSIYNQGIKSVSTLDGVLTGSIEYSRKTFEETKYSKGNKYTNKSGNSYHTLGRKIRVVSEKTPRYLLVRGLFADPIAVAEANGDICSTCGDIRDLDFAIDPAEVEALITLTIQECVVSFSQVVEDRRNDTSDDPPEKTK